MIHRQWFQLDNSRNVTFQMLLYNVVLQFGFTISFYNVVSALRDGLTVDWSTIDDHCRRSHSACQFHAIASVLSLVTIVTENCSGRKRVAVHGRHSKRHSKRVIRMKRIKSNHLNRENQEAIQMERLKRFESFERRDSNWQSRFSSQSVSLIGLIKGSTWRVHGVT